MPATNEISTEERLGVVTQYPVAAATKIWAGTQTALNSSGYLVPASDTAGLRIAGRAEQTVDNTGGIAGAATCNVKQGVFLYANSGDDAVEAGDVGRACYVDDDMTVNQTGGDHKIRAGRVVEVAANGVWVDQRPPSASADSLTALTFTPGGATGPEVEALRAAVLSILRNAGIVG